MAPLVHAINEGLSRGSRRQEQHSRSDPGGESLSPLVPGGRSRHELAARFIRFMRASGPVLLGGELHAQHNKVLHEKSLGGSLDDGVNGGHPK
jgi:hypothetical protein